MKGGGRVANDLYKKCRLCARQCGVDRTVDLGYCRVPDSLCVARAALHHWEEPSISGTRGSGAIFFSGCSLSCIFCQNREISRAAGTLFISVERLADIMLELQGKGAHNINLVTPTHYAPSIREAIILARKNGLVLPIVYNTGGYDTVETLRTLDGIVDIYMPDMKYYRSDTARKYSAAHDYPTVAMEAIDEMVRQRGAAVIDTDGIMRSGVIVRVLLLPSHLAEAKLTVKKLYDKYGDGIYISLMSQYTPMPDMPHPLDRCVTAGEYRELVEYAERIGVTYGYVQEGGSADESFIPPFDNTGVLP